MAENEIKRVITIESSESLNTLNHLSARIKELKGNMNDLDITTEEYRQVSEEVAQLENVKRNAIRGVTAAVEGSYNAYSKELSILQKHRKTLNENSDEYKELTKRVAELQEHLKQMDADVGVYSRNVGNYSSAFNGLQGSVNGVVAKLPALKSGMSGFAESMNESLPRLIESVQQYKAMAEEAGVAANVMGALTKSLLSWNMVVSVAVTVIAVFGEKIAEWVKQLFKATSAMTIQQRAVEEFSKAIEEQGLGIGDEIVKLKELQDAWNSLGNDMDAKRKHIIDNKEAFDELGISVKNVADAEKFYIDQTDDYIEALKSRAIAEAAKRQAETYYDKMVAAQVANDIDRARYVKMPDKVYEKNHLLTAMAGTGNIFYKEVDSEAKKELGATIAARDKEIADYERMGDALFELAKGYEAAGKQKYNFTNPTTPSSSSFKAGAYRDSADRQSTINPAADWGIADAVDASAEREVLKKTLEARTKMLTANAEERKSIEEKLNADLIMIEELRLIEHEIILAGMLNSDELTAEERMAIEDELTKNKIAQSDLQLKAEEERAKKTKALKDKEVAEEKTRKAQMKQIADTMASTTSSLLKQGAELLEEDSKERKALNAAAIVMDTYKAAMAAWTAAQGLPPGIGQAVGAANVAASVAMGAMQLANLYKVAADGANAMSALSSAQSAPNVASSMPASYTRSLQGDNELTEMNKDTRVYVVESDITNAQKSARVRVESATF
jgi:hypothetical protein